MKYVLAAIVAMALSSGAASAQNAPAPAAPPSQAPVTPPDVATPSAGPAIATSAPAPSVPAPVPTAPGPIPTPPGPAPTAPGTPTAPSTAAPILSPPPTPYGPATAAPSAVPAGTPNPYHYTYSPPPLTSPPADAGQILEIDLSDQNIHVPGHLSVRVLTTPNVSAVSIRAMGREIAIPKAAPGIFGAEQDLPDIPFFFKHRWNVDFIAATDSGRRTTVTVPIAIK